MQLLPLMCLAILFTDTGRLFFVFFQRIAQMDLEMAERTMEFQLKAHATRKLFFLNSILSIPYE